MTTVPFNVDNGIAPTVNNTVDVGTVTHKFRNAQYSADVSIGGDLTVAQEFNQGGIASASEEDAIVYAIVLGG